MSTPGGAWRSGSLNPGTGGNRDTYVPEAGTLATQAERAAAAEHDARTGRKPRIEVVPTIIGVALLVLGALLIAGSNPGAPAGTFNEGVFILGAIPVIVGILLIASRLARLRRQQLDLRSARTPPQRPETFVTSDPHLSPSHGRWCRAPRAESGTGAPKRGPAA